MTKCDKKFLLQFQILKENSTVFFFPNVKLPSEHNKNVAKIRTKCGNSGILLDLFHLTYCTK